MRSSLNLPRFTGRRSLREDVTAAIRAALVTGTMEPGELYSAPRLAEQFGVSATPVREALLDLVTEGHFDVVRNKGFRVRGLSSAELDQLAEIRLFLEPPAMAAVARAAASSPAVAEAVEALRPRAAQIVHFAERGELLSYLEADTEFHTAFLGLHGNDRLVEVVRGLRTRSRLFGLERQRESGMLAALAAEHIRMVDLGVAGDAEALAALVRRHIEHVRQEWAGDAGKRPHDGRSRHPGRSQLDEDSGKTPLDEVSAPSGVSARPAGVPLRDPDE